MRRLDGANHVEVAMENRLFEKNRFLRTAGYLPNVQALGADAIAPGARSSRFVFVV